MNRLVHFEIASKDPEATAEFYRKTFCWEIQKWDGPIDYWMVKTGENDCIGINGGLMNEIEGMPQVINTIDVVNCDEYMEKISANGGKLLTPKITVPQVGYMAYFMDSTGAVFSIMQEDSTAEQEYTK